MVEQAGAQLDVDLVRGLAEHERSQRSQYHFEERDDSEADHQYVEGREAAVHQYLIDNNLEEQRRDEPEQLQEKRSDQYLADNAPVSPHRGNKPAQIKDV